MWVRFVYPRLSAGCSLLSFATKGSCTLFHPERPGSRFPQSRPSSLWDWAFSYPSPSIPSSDLNALQWDYSVPRSSSTAGVLWAPPVLPRTRGSIDRIYRPQGDHDSVVGLPPSETSGPFPDTVLSLPVLSGSVELTPPRCPVGTRVVHPRCSGEGRWV